jgi:hypothetical protein
MVADQDPEPDTPALTSSPLSFREEVRDAVTPRSALLVIGVLLLQLGFIASYLAAFHSPAPRHVPIAVVLPTGTPAASADALKERLNTLPTDPLSVTVVPTEAEARQRILDRTSDGAIVFMASGPDRLLVASGGGGALSEALTIVTGKIEANQHRTFTVVDVRPASEKDTRGLSPFYLAVGWVVGGYLVAAILGIAGGAAPANRNRATIRLAALALYAVVSGLGGALIAGNWLDALPGHLVGLWLIGSMVVFGVGAFTMAMQVLFDVIGIGIAILLFVVLGNPSAGGAYPAPLLPPFWATIGPWLPPGAATNLIRGTVYFDGAETLQSWLVMAAYAIVGVTVALLVTDLRDRQKGDPVHPI